MKFRLDKKGAILKRNKPQLCKVKCTIISKYNFEVYYAITLLFTKCITFMGTEFNYHLQIITGLFINMCHGTNILGYFLRKEKKNYVSFNLNL